MKYLRLPLFLLLALSVLVYTGCDDDEDDFTQDELRYDGAPFSAPNIEVQEFAAYFPGNVTGQFDGRRLETVSFYLAEVPDRTIVKIYPEGSDDSSPASQPIYTRDITQRVNVGQAWIDHRLAEDIVLGSQGLWIAIEVTSDQPGFPFQSVGCDDGSNFNPNGDRLKVDGAWTNFEEFTGTERVNWNIRGIVAPE